VPPEEPGTGVIRGSIGGDLRPFNPLIEILPRRLHLTAGSSGAWVAPVLYQAVSESRRLRPARAAALRSNCLPAQRIARAPLASAFGLIGAACSGFDCMSFVLPRRQKGSASLVSAKPTHVK